MRKIVIAMLMPMALASTHGAPLSPSDEANAGQTEETCKLSALAYREHCRQSVRRQHLEGIALRDDVSTCMAREP